MEGKELWKLIYFVKKLEADIQTFIKKGKDTDDEEMRATWQGMANGVGIAAGGLKSLLKDMHTKKNKEGLEIRRDGGTGMEGKELWRLFNVLQKLEVEAQVSCDEMDETNDEKKKARLEGKSVGLSMAAQRLLKALKELNT